jgi:hypothetical protein
VLVYFTGKRFKTSGQTVDVFASRSIQDSRHMIGAEAHEGGTYSTRPLASVPTTSHRTKLECVGYGLRYL